MLEAGAQAECLEECRRTVRWLDGPPGKTPPHLPVCRDPDDQKFIDLARCIGAGTLLSRDRAVLKLAARARRLGVLILTPTAWAGSLAHQTDQ